MTVSLQLTQANPRYLILHPSPKRAKRLQPWKTNTTVFTNSIQTIITKWQQESRKALYLKLTLQINTLFASPLTNLCTQGTSSHPNHRAAKRSEIKPVLQKASNNQARRPLAPLGIDLRTTYHRWSRLAISRTKMENLALLTANQQYLVREKISAIRPPLIIRVILGPLSQEALATA